MLNIVIYLCKRAFFPLVVVDRSTINIVPSLKFTLCYEACHSMYINNLAFTYSLNSNSMQAGLQWRVTLLLNIFL